MAGRKRIRGGGETGCRRGVGTGSFAGHATLDGTSANSLTNPRVERLIVTYPIDGRCHSSSRCASVAATVMRFCPTHLAELRRIRDEFEREEAEITRRGGIRQHAIVRQYDRKTGGWVDH